MVYRIFLYTQQGAEEVCEYPGDSSGKAAAAADLKEYRASRTGLYIMKRCRA